MKVGLLNVDSRNFPNLCLMKKRIKCKKCRIEARIGLIGKKKRID